MGLSRDTSEFAVESIRQWWNRFGKHHYPDAKGLLICAAGTPEEIAKVKKS